jgi:hypothetical protein
MSRITRIDKNHMKPKQKTPKSADSLVKIACDLEKIRNGENKVTIFQQRVNDLSSEKSNDPRIGRLLSEANKEQHGNFFEWLSMIAQGNQLPAEEALKE